MDMKTLTQMGNNSPYFKHLGMVLVEAGEGYAKVRMKIKPFHANIEGVVHGGALASLADQAAVRAVQTMLPVHRNGVTLQMDTHFLAPARGPSLVGKGRVQKMGHQVAVSDAEILDEEGETVAMARCTIRIIDKE